MADSHNPMIYSAPTEQLSASLLPRGASSSDADSKAAAPINIQPAVANQQLSPEYQAIIDDAEAQVAYRARKIELLEIQKKAMTENAGLASIGIEMDEDYVQLVNQINALYAEIEFLNNKIKQYKKEHNSNWEWLKNRVTWANFMSSLGLGITSTDLTGTTGFTTKVAMESTEHGNLIGTNKFFMVLAAPFALFAIGAGTLIDTINTLLNYKSIDNLKTRLGANGLTLGIVGVALAAVLGAPALAAAVAVPFFVPALFMGILIAGYVKEREVHKHTKQELETAEGELIAKEKSLIAQLSALNERDRAAIDSKMKELASLKELLNQAKADRITALTAYASAQNKALAQLAVDSKTAEVERLKVKIGQVQTEFNDLNGAVAIQISLDALHMQQRKVNILQLTVNHQRENRNVNRAFIAAVGMFLLGLAFTLFPFTAPIGIPLLLVSGAALYAGLNYNESNNTDKAKQSVLLNNTEPKVEATADGKSTFRKNIGYHIAAIAVAVAVTVALTILTGGIALVVAAMASILACAVIGAYKKYKQSAEREALVTKNMTKTDRSIDVAVIGNAQPIVAPAVHIGPQMQRLSVAPNSNQQRAAALGEEKGNPLVVPSAMASSSAASPVTPSATDRMAAQSLQTNPYNSGASLSAQQRAPGSMAPNAVLLPAPHPSSGQPKPDDATLAAQLTGRQI